MVSLLVIEDDPGIRSAMVRSLTGRGYSVDCAPTGLAGLEAVIDQVPDLVLLDLGLPDLDGQQVLLRVREVSDVPVIVVTAQESDGSIVQALDAGADDHVVKPFGADHLEARVRAVLRRRELAASAEPVQAGGLRIDPRCRTAELDGRALDLTRKEFDLLHLLAARQGQVISKRELMAEVWRLPYGGGERTLDVHLSWLRRKLGESGLRPRYVHTVHGIGIRLTPPVGDEPNSTGDRAAVEGTRAAS